MIDRWFVWLAIGIFAVSATAAVILPPLGTFMGWR
jgi:hypothetical protein